jgi:hypothetical protein
MDVIRSTETSVSRVPHGAVSEKMATLRIAVRSSNLTAEASIRVVCCISSKQFSADGRSGEQTRGTIDGGGLAPGCKGMTRDFHRQVGLCGLTSAIL